MIGLENHRYYSPHNGVKTRVHILTKELGCDSDMGLDDREPPETSLVPDKS